MAASIRVLHVDDEPGFTELTKEFLEGEDERFEVTGARSAAEGLDRLAERRFDCVVSDYDMPGQNGIEFLEAVRDDHPDLPFILYTGKGSEAVASDAISAGATDYLQKESGTGQYAVLANRVANAVAQYREELRYRYRYAALFENTDDAIVWIELDDGTPIIEDANAVFEELFAPPGVDVVGRDIDEVVTGADRYDDAREVTRRVEEHGRIAGEVVRDTVNGPRDFLLRGVPVEDPGGGENAQGYVGIYTDITERKERERELERSRERLRTLFDSAPDGIVIHDADGTVVDVNDTMAEMLGYAPETLAEMHVSDFEVGFAEAELLEMWEAHDGESLLKVEGTHRRADGSTFPVEVWVDALEIDGEKRFLAHVRDVTGRERRERELERQNERLEEFASVVSHDLRSPLKVAEGRLDLARRECESDHLAAVADSHDRMRTLIDDLLTLARQDDPVDETARVDLARVAADSWEPVAATRASLAVETDRTIRADEARLRQLLENLFRNAVEHGSTSPRSSSTREDAVEHGSTSSRAEPDDAVEHGSTSPPSHAQEDAVEHGSTSNRPSSDDAVEHGGERVTVTVGDLPDGDGFYVADDGPGIPPEDRDRVFESGYSTAEDGTGFGLDIVERVADAHGWSVDVTESADGGARFEVTGVEVE